MASLIEKDYKMQKELENSSKSYTKGLRNVERARKFYSKTLMNAIVSCSDILYSTVYLINK